MTDKKKEELRKAICASYPGVSEAEISFMISFFDMMQAKANGFSSAKGGGKTEAKGGGGSEAKGGGKTEAKGGGGSEANGGGKTAAKGNGKTTDEGGIKTKANRLVDSGRSSKTYSTSQSSSVRSRCSGGLGCRQTSGWGICPRCSSQRLAGRDIIFPSTPKAMWITHRKATSTRMKGSVLTSTTDRSTR